MIDVYKRQANANAKKLEGIKPEDAGVEVKAEEVAAE